MFGNYLGIKAKPGQSQSQRVGASRAPKADATTRCQKCEGYGHYSFDCKKGAVYKARPTRSAILRDPKKMTAVTGTKPPQDILGGSTGATNVSTKEGTAAAILEANALKRAKAIEAGPSGSRRRSASSDSSSVSSSSSDSDSSDSDSSEDSRRRSWKTRRRSSTPPRRAGAGGSGEGRRRSESPRSPPRRRSASPEDRGRSRSPEDSPPRRRRDSRDSSR